MGCARVVAQRLVDVHSVEAQTCARSAHPSF